MCFVLFFKPLFVFVQGKDDLITSIRQINPFSDL